MKAKRIVIAICCFAVLVLIAALLINSGDPSKPPKLTVSNEYGEKVKALQGTYSWQTGPTSGINVDSIGPLALYDRGELQYAESSENDDYSLILTFGKRPEYVSVLVYPESAAAAEDYEARIQRDVSPKMSGYRFTIPEDGMCYIVEVFAKWKKGTCAYYFYTST